MVVLGGINMNNRVIPQLTVLDLEKMVWQDMSLTAIYTNPFKSNPLFLLISLFGP